MKKKVIIIGSGFGGLATAVRLAHRGLDVELFEKLDQAGGRAQSLDINGFIFDGGPSVITAPFILDELFSAVGRSREDYFKITPLDPFFRILNVEGQLFDFNGDPQSILNQMENLVPSDKEGCQKLIQASQAVYEKGFLKLANRSFNHVADMLKVAPGLVHLGAYKTIYQHVSQFIKNDFLRQVFSITPLLIGANPFETSSLYTVSQCLGSKWGMFSAEGGTGAIVAGLTRLIEELGGKIHLNAEVTEILVEGRKVSGVRLMDGSIHRADLIVSNADVAWTYKNLIAPRWRHTMTNRRLDRYRYSHSLFVIYFGTRVRYLDTRLSHHNILLAPRYRGLLADISQHKRLADDFLLTLHIPTLANPGLAPEGCEGFVVMAPVPHLGSGIDWTRMARPYRDRIMQFLEQTYLPDLQANIIAEHYVDPLYFQNTLNSINGSAYSFATNLTQTAWFRPHNRSEEFSNLYFCGAGTHPGPGLPGVLFSARIVENLIVADRP